MFLPHKIKVALLWLILLVSLPGPIAVFLGSTTGAQVAQRFLPTSPAAPPFIFIAPNYAAPARYEVISENNSKYTFALDAKTVENWPDSDRRRSSLVRGLSGLAYINSSPPNSKEVLFGKLLIQKVFCHIDQTLGKFQSGEKIVRVQQIVSTKNEKMEELNIDCL